MFDWKKGQTKDELVPIRTELGTLPHVGQVRTKFYRGAEATEVELVTSPDNPYRSMYVFALQTWGTASDSKLRRWEDATPEQRMKVIYAVMNRKALPLALETPAFVFEVRNAGRPAFDQVARMRVGVTFSSEGTQDNDHRDTGVIIPPRIWDDEDLRHEFVSTVIRTKHSYARLVDMGASWGDARYELPQGIVHRFGWAINYMALAGFMGQRLRFCMHWGTVAIAWQARKALASRFAVLTEPLRPSCDAARRCNYRSEGDIGEAFSNLYSGCKRWPDENPVGEFPYPYTEKADIERWIGESVMPGDAPLDWVSAFQRDYHYFNEGAV